MRNFPRHARALAFLLLSFGVSGTAGPRCRSCLRTEDGRIARSSQVKREFRRMNPCPATGDVTGLCLNDPRQAWKVVYPLTEILLLVLCGTLAGAETFVEIERWGAGKLGFLRRFLPFAPGIPAHDLPASS